MRCLAVLLILLWTLPASAGIFQQRHLAVLEQEQAAAGGGCADTTCTGFDVCQNFELTGYDNSETWNETLGGGTCDEDSTTNTLRGSQSLRIVSGSPTTSTVKGTNYSYSEGYGHFLFSVADATPASNLLIARLWSSGAVTLANIYVTTTGLLQANVGGSTANTVDALSDATTYHVWWYYKVSTGSDGVFSVEFTPAATRAAVGSGNKYAAITDHTNTNNAIRSVAITNISGATVDYDQWLMRTTAIGTVCE